MNHSLPSGHNQEQLNSLNLTGFLPQSSQLQTYNQHAHINPSFSSGLVPVSNYWSWVLDAQLRGPQSQTSSTNLPVSNYPFVGFPYSNFPIPFQHAYPLSIAGPPPPAPSNTPHLNTLAYPSPGSASVNSHIHIPQKAFTPSDESALADAISTGEEGDKDLNDIIKDLSGVNGHSTGEWIEFYLQNTAKIRDHIRILSSRSCTRNKTQAVFSPSKPHHLGISLHSHLGTRLSTQASSKGRRSKGRHNNVPISDRVQCLLKYSCSGWPEPPTTVKKHPSRGNRYTNEDEEFFIRFYACSLQRDPSLPHSYIISLVSKQTPHHSRHSWRAWALVNSTLVKEIRSQVLGDGGESDSKQVKKLKLPLPSSPKGDSSYKGGDEEDYIPDLPLSPPPETSDSEDDDEDDDSSVQTQSSDDEEPSQVTIAMAKRGRAVYWPRDKKLVAEFIAKDKTWGKSQGRTALKWRRFADENQHNPHTPKGWTEFYRRNKLEIDEKARRCRIRARKRREAAALEYRGASRMPADTEPEDGQTNYRLCSGSPEL